MVKWLLNFLIPKATNYIQPKRFADAVFAFRRYRKLAKNSGQLSFEFCPYWFDLTKEYEDTLMELIVKRGYDVVPKEFGAGYVIYFPGVYK